MTLHPVIATLGESYPKHFFSLSQSVGLHEVIAPRGAQIALLATLLERLSSDQRVAVAVTASTKESNELASSLRAFVDELEIVYLPSWETLPHERLSPSPETVGRRVMALARMRELASNPPRHPTLIVLSVRAALQPIAAGLGQAGALNLARGQQYSFIELPLKLIEYAYERVEMVTRRGEFAVRGGIVDVFPTTAEHALRLEFFGDELDDVREFAVADQRSLPGQLDSVSLYPARELLITPAVAGRAREAEREFPNLTEMLEKIANGIPTEGMESLTPMLVDEMVSVFTMVPKAIPIFLLNPEKLLAQAISLKQTNDEFLHAAWDAAIEGAEAPIDLSAGGFHDFDALFANLATQHPVVRLAPFGGEKSINLGLHEPPSSVHAEEGIFDWLRQQLQQQHRILITCAGHGTAERVLELLVDAKIPAILTEHLGSLHTEHVTVLQANLAHGFVSEPAKLTVITETEFFGRNAAPAGVGPKRLARRRGPQVDPLTLQRGDYVVHEIHGIGRFVELVQRSNGSGERRHTREYLVIEYASPKKGYPADTLFVPTDQLDMLTRYVGGEAPVLSKMGGVDWARAKGNARKAVRKIAIDLVKLYSARMKSKGYSFSPDTTWQRELEEAFPFQETPDQLTTIDEVKRDMERGIPMDRLLAGDVGYGKTEVAVRAAFKAIQDGKQVAMLVPTTLLVKQHFETFMERYSGFPVQIRALSRFQTDRELKDTLAGLESGGVDMVIGTHRLLSDSVKFKNLGLVIIDEEQRFGVEHKEKLKALRHNVDVLAMSATPIPRTLEMAVTGIREMSTLATPPEERQPILTFVGAYSEQQVAAAIRRELIREGQVFFVHNRVSTINLLAEQLQKLVPEARIGIAHGQLPEQQLEQVVVDFWERKFDVLVSTTIIETGIDIPNANTLIVDRAEIFGLSQLHQIRGRVGRSRERAYAYFFYDPSRPLSLEAHDRLATIATHNELGSGMQVAMKDLEIRGAGNLLGGEQSGHIAGVGFDLYLRMIDEAVREFKGETLESPAELKLELPVDAHIPATYLDSERLRLEAYHKLSAASGAKSNRAQLDAILAEIEDRYGKAPASVRNLIDVTELRQQCNRLGLKDVNLLGAQLQMSPVELTEAQQVALSVKIPGMRYLQTSKMLSAPTPKDAAGEPLRDSEVIAWTWAFLAKVFDGAGSQAN